MLNPNILILAIAESVFLLVVSWQLIRGQSYARFWKILSIAVVFILEAGYTLWIALALRASLQAKGCKLCSYYLPPHSNYLYFESFGRYGAYFGIFALTGLLFGLAFWIFARLTKNEIIDGDDVFLLLLSGVMIGWPNILIFLGLIFVLAILLGVVKRLLGPRVQSQRVIITPLIILAAIPVLLWGDLFAHWLRIYDLGFVAITLQR